MPTYTINGKRVTSERPLSDEDIEEISRSVGRPDVTQTPSMQAAERISKGTPATDAYNTLKGVGEELGGVVSGIPSRIKQMAGPYGLGLAIPPLAAWNMRGDVTGIPGQIRSEGELVNKFATGGPGGGVDPESGGRLIGQGLTGLAMGRLPVAEALAKAPGEFLGQQTAAIRGAATAAGNQALRKFPSLQVAKAGYDAYKGGLPKPPPGVPINNANIAEAAQGAAKVPTYAPAPSGGSSPVTAPESLAAVKQTAGLKPIAEQMPRRAPEPLPPPPAGPTNATAPVIPQSTTSTSLTPAAIPQPNVNLRPGVEPPALPGVGDIESRFADVRAGQPKFPMPPKGRPVGMSPRAAEARSAMGSREWVQVKPKARQQLPVAERAALKGAEPYRGVQADIKRTLRGVKPGKPAPPTYPVQDLPHTVVSPEDIMRDRLETRTMLQRLADADALKPNISNYFEQTAPEPIPGKWPR